MMRKFYWMFSLIFFLSGCSTSFRVVDLYLEDTEGNEIMDITIADAEKKSEFYISHIDPKEGKLKMYLPKKKQNLDLEFYKIKEGYKNYNPKNIYRHQFITLTPADSEISLTFEKTNSYLKHEILLDKLIRTTQIVQGTVLDDMRQTLPDVFVKVLNLPLEFDDESFWAITDEYGRFEVRVNKVYNQIQFNHRDHQEKIIALKSFEKPITVKLQLAITE